MYYKCIIYTKCLPSMTKLCSQPCIHTFVFPCSPVINVIPFVCLGFCSAVGFQYTYHWLAVCAHTHFVCVRTFCTCAQPSVHVLCSLARLPCMHPASKMCLKRTACSQGWWAGPPMISNTGLPKLVQTG